MTLDDAVAQVRQLHQHIGASVADAPQLLPCVPGNVNRLAAQLLQLSLVASNLGAETGDLLLLRLGMSLEEISEWLLAHSRKDLVAAADAWADRLYVLLGDAVSAGLPAEDLFAEVHRSNMTKEARTDWPGKGGERHRFPTARHPGCSARVAIPSRVISRTSPL